MENQMDNTGTWLTDQNISESGGRVRWPGIAALFCGLTWLAGSPSLAQDNDNWATPWSALLGVELESRHKSGGAPAWDWQDYPTVFMATDNLGFGGLMGGAGILQMQPGLSIFDAASHEVIATVHYDVLSWDWENPAEPHGLGVSPDGAWIYLPTGERKANGNNIGRLLIISAKTLKVDKVLVMAGNPHLIKSFRDTDGNARVLIESFNSTLQPSFVLDPDDDNKVVGGWNNDQLGDRRSSVSFIDPDGASVLVVGSLPSGGQTPEAYATWIDTRTWQATGAVRIPAITPLWATFDAGNQFVYLNDSRGETVGQYDLASNQMISQMPSGVQKPYGTHLGWGDRFVYSIGEDAASGRRGRAIGVMDTSADTDSQQYRIDCMRANHATLHPDPKTNALWITCDATGEVIIFDMTARQVTARLPLPDGGSIHAGAFVNYRAGVAEVVSDLNGLQGSALTKKRQLLGLQ